MKVYESIRLVTAAMSANGIGKGRKNTQQGYNFRGIDDVLNALSAELVAANLAILPRVIDRTVAERATKNGGALFYVTVKVDFDFVHTGDGSKHTVTTYGEAMDSADKATNKAMSAAFKYMALLSFCIPTEGTPDADYDTPEIRARNEQPAHQHAAASIPVGGLQKPANLSQAELDFMLDSMREATTMAALRGHYDAAHSAAQSVGDDDAVSQIIRLKDERILSIKAHANATKEKA